MTAGVLLLAFVAALALACWCLKAAGTLRSALAELEPEPPTGPPERHAS